jgi:glycosyltransferase involved in cell wall biosynthesis
MSASRTVRRARILEITSYPPPRAGWGVRVEFLKQHLEAAGHECVVLNIGKSRNIPSTEYETVAGAGDYVRKVWRFCRSGFVTHVHINGSTAKGLVLTIAAQMLNLLCGKRCVLTFHAGVKQVYFPRAHAPLLWPVFWIMFTLPRTIICNNEAVKAKIQEYGIPGRKIRPIPAFSRQYLEAEAESLDPRIESFYQRFDHIVFTYVRVRDGFYLETLVDGFRRLAARRADVGLVVCGVAGDINPVLWQKVERGIAEHRLADRVCIVDDLPHEHFLAALKRSSLYLRTPTSDGVASSVLEALAMGVPVVAAENGTRPAGTITYAPADGGSLADAVDLVLSDRAAAVAAIPPVPVRDTLHEEATLLAAS